MLRVNMFEAEPEFDPADPEGYRGAARQLGRELGSDELSLNLFEIPAGESLCPYHYEYVEEWLLILEGAVTLRDPDGDQELVRGDLVRFPAGPDGAHKLTNPSETPSRLIMFSSSEEPAVTVYPDSDKVGVWAPGAKDRWMFRGGEANLDYYDGEV